MRHSQTHLLAGLSHQGLGLLPIQLPTSCCPSRSCMQASHPSALTPPGLVPSRRYTDATLKHRLAKLERADKAAAQVRGGRAGGRLGWALGARSPPTSILLPPACLHPPAHSPACPPIPPTYRTLAKPSFHPVHAAPHPPTHTQVLLDACEHGAGLDVSLVRVTRSVVVRFDSERDGAYEVLGMPEPLIQDGTFQARPLGWWCSRN